MKRRNPLTTERIVSAAVDAIDQQGASGLSMRKLGAALGVDPMAIYHHVPNREALIVLALAQVLADEMPALEEGAWEAQVLAWARSYRTLVSAHRSLTYEALRNPSAVDQVATRATRPLVAAIARSGVTKRRATEHADLIVDYVHGHALALSPDNVRAQRRTFDAAIRTIIAGIAATRQPV
jgi:TetR/AcrR family tetracycline transcriptional repressor